MNTIKTIKILMVLFFIVYGQIKADCPAFLSVGSFAAGSFTESVAYSPNGKFAAVTNAGSNTVTVYSVNTLSGVLTTIQTIGAGSNPDSIAFSPNGEFAIVANEDSSNVSVYSVNQQTGLFTQ